MVQTRRGKEGPIILVDQVDDRRAARQPNRARAGIATGSENRCI
jgi:hypothetical protein